MIVYCRTQMVSHQLNQALGELKAEVDLLKARSANDQNQVRQNYGREKKEHGNSTEDRCFWVLEKCV